MKKLFILPLFLISFAVAANTSTCRSTTVKHHFDVSQGYPLGRPGYVVDHICALEVGGLDITSNMQYQTIAEGKLKDKIERTAYGRTLYCNDKNSTSTRTVFNCN